MRGVLAWGSINFSRDTDSGKARRQVGVLLNFTKQREYSSCRKDLQN